MPKRVSLSIGPAHTYTAHAPSVPGTVRWLVKLWDDGDATGLGSCNEGGDISMGVDTGWAEGASLGEQRKGSGLDGEGLVVSDVPMQDVQLETTPSLM